MPPAESSNVQIWVKDQHCTSPPKLQGDISCDVCVVGLGGSGLTAVSELVNMGFKVVGIDAKDVGAGAAGRNGGFLLAGLSEFYHDAVRKFGAEFTLSIYK